MGCLLLGTASARSVSSAVGVTLEWAGQENADFWATDLGSAVSNVVLRIVGQSVACASLGH